MSNYPQGGWISEQEGEKKSHGIEFLFLDLRAVHVRFVVDEMTLK
jgi:hypothetical protein